MIQEVKLITQFGLSQVRQQTLISNGFGRHPIEAIISKRFNPCWIWLHWTRQRRSCDSSRQFCWGTLKGVQSRIHDIHWAKKSQPRALSWSVGRARRFPRSQSAPNCSPSPGPHDIYKQQVAERLRFFDKHNIDYKDVLPKKWVSDFGPPLDDPRQSTHWRVL